MNRLAHLLNQEFIEEPEPESFMDWDLDRLDKSWKEYQRLVELDEQEQQTEKK